MASTMGTEVGPAVVSERRLPPGTLVGEYQISGVLGQGGMGVVYAGIHPVIGKEVAIKLLRPRAALTPGVVDRFVQEARAVNQIRHPNIIDVFAYGTHAEQPYIVMERLHGETLGRRLQRGPLSLVELAALVAPITLALEATHAVDIVHRDLKPDNIFLVAGEPTVVKILDFGIAKVAAGLSSAVITESGVMMGTPQYMPPEQARGQLVDGSGDVYALGVMVYEMLTGEPPFVVDNAADAIAAHLTDEPPSVATRRVVPAALADVVARMLAKQPARRPSLAEVRAVCLAASTTELVGRQPRRRAPALAAAVVMAALVAVILLRERGGAPASTTPGAAPSSGEVAAALVAGAGSRPGPATTPADAATPAPVASPVDGALTVVELTVVPATALVTVAGQRTRPSAGLVRLALPSGRHVVTVTAPGHRAASVTLEAAGVPLAQVVKLERTGSSRPLTRQPPDPRSALGRDDLISDPYQ